MYEIRACKQVRFVHFIAYFGKIKSIDELSKNNSLPKTRSIMHYLALNGHLHLFKDFIKACPQINLNL